jgi:predicted ATPase/DNA-binding NarL/FixJ family response regulator
MATRAASTERPRVWSLPQRSQPEPALGNIAHEVNAFVGREAELDRLRDLHVQSRLLTLLGPSGVGKTRLAVRLQADVREGYPDGAWLVDLMPVADPALVPQAVGDVLGVHQRPGQPWLSELIRFLGPRRLLLLLDNCEHLVAACAELADGLLRACPNLRLLATSLQPLGAASETVWRVPPLSVPVLEADGPASVEASEAVRLFATRVRARLPDFAVDEHNARPVVEICRELDGLPLALELVAARVESLGLAAVAARLHDRFALAAGGSQQVPSRQRTLRAALEWSWSLLDENEQVLLRRLAVFVGGWTLDAAEAVCGGEGSCNDAVVDVTGRLVSKSLVVADHDGLSVRYRLLESIRAHALGQLVAAGERDALQRQHAAHLVQVAERADLLSVEQAPATVLRPEEGNVRAALDWTIESGQVEMGLRLAAAAFPLWVYSGHYTEGLAWLDRLLAMPAGVTVDSARAAALTIGAQLSFMLGDFTSALARGEAALDMQQVRGDERGTSLALTMLGNASVARGDLARARALYADAARRTRQAGGPMNVLIPVQLGLIACELGDVEHARRLIAEIQAMGEARGDPYPLAAVALFRGLLAAADGDASAAARTIEHALALVRTHHNQQGIVVALTSLGHVRLDQGQSAAALAAFAEAIQLAHASGEHVRLLRALDGFARVIATTDADAAVRLAGATAVQRQALDIVPHPSERRYLDGWLVHARRTLGPRAYPAAWNDGQASTLEQAVSLAETIVVTSLSASPTGGLSAREQEVARLLARGLTNKQIAAELVVSPGTVRTHVEHILAKLELHSRAQIAAWVSQQSASVPAD